MSIDIEKYLEGKYRRQLNAMYREFWAKNGNIAARRFINSELNYIATVIPILIRLEIIETEDRDEFMKRMRHAFEGAMTSLSSYQPADFK